jgi:hypothetical protein
MVVLDVVDERVVCFEVLYPSGVRERLSES